MSQTVSFEQVRKAVRQWYLQSQTVFSVNSLIIDDCPKCFRAITHTEHCIAGVLVAEADFAPYRWVSFQVFGLPDTASRNRCTATTTRHRTLKERFSIN